MSQVNTFKKSLPYVGFSLMELDPESLNCPNKTLFNTKEFVLNLTQSQLNSKLKSNLWIRTYTSGCYYLNKTNIWSNDGMEIYEDSNSTHTHCVTNHLTTFAGGFVVLPNAIDFNYVWSHASFTKNPIVYSLVIALVCIYFIMALWCRYMDYRDKQKCNITLLGNLKDDETKEAYFYEIIVFTGIGIHSGTKSKVF